MSGWASASHSSSRGRRLLMPLTLKVAIFTPGSGRSSVAIVRPHAVLDERPAAVRHRLEDEVDAVRMRAGGAAVARHVDAGGKHHTAGPWPTDGGGVLAAHQGLPRLAVVHIGTDDGAAGVAVPIDLARIGERVVGPVEVHVAPADSLGRGAVVAGLVVGVVGVGKGLR